MCGAALASQYRGSASSFYAFDSQYSTRILVSVGGLVTDSYNYTSWGVEGASGSGTANPLRYVGQYGYQRDLANWMNVGQRPLDAANGRWVSRDPIGYEGGDWNIFRYVANNVALLIDPSGLGCGRGSETVESAGDPACLLWVKGGGSTTTPCSPQAQLLCGGLGRALGCITEGSFLANNICCCRWHSLPDCSGIKFARYAPGRFDWPKGKPEAIAIGDIVGSTCEGNYTIDLGRTPDFDFKGTSCPIQCDNTPDSGFHITYHLIGPKTSNPPNRKDCVLSVVCCACTDGSGVTYIRCYCNGPHTGSGAKKRNCS
jgi:RHS repeat-associated protein